MSTKRTDTLPFPIPPNFGEPIAYLIVGMNAKGEPHICSTGNPTQVLFLGAQGLNHALSGLVVEVNHRARHFVERFGFLLQAALPHADPDGALCLYTLKKSDCRFLRSPYHG